MEITVNGTCRTVADGASVRGLLAEIGLSEDRVAVELNRVILQRVDYGTAMLSEGDVLEIVGFVGGG